jgi:excinuclease ABC subunit B
MGTSGDHAEPAGAIERSLFRKQSAREAHGSDFGIPEDERRSSGRPAAVPPGAPPRSEPRSGDSVSENRQSLFRKNTLDEMTVRRTEKPVEGAKPVKRETIGRGSYEDPADERDRRRRSKKSGRPGQ